jgi:hypothetical protein
MRHWLLVTRPWNWRICETQGLFGLDDRYRTTLTRFVVPGDLTAIYVTGLGIVGVVEITEILPDQAEGVGWKRGVKEVRRHPCLVPSQIQMEVGQRFDAAIKIDPRSNNRLDELEYFTEKSKSWYSFVYPTIARLPVEDIETILRW